ncbi:MAG: hypothetical protein KA586_02065 [Candidatus Promineofilum sp.]|nr:hypothetical protein [Promineifilum sp.]
MKHAKHDRELSGILGKPVLSIILFIAVALAVGSLIVATRVFALGYASQSRLAGKDASSDPYPNTLTFPPRAFIPLIRAATVPLPPPLPPPLVLAGQAPIDFAAEAIELQAQGLKLSFNKIGFHAGDRGRWADLVDMMTQLDAAGVPFFLKSTDNAQPLYIAQELMKKSGVPHTLVYRRVSGVDNVPNYDADPKAAAAYHWAQHKAIFPPELDPEYVWVETVNEVDKNRAAWLADFAYETAQLTLHDGFRWAAFGWSSGEPEPADWESPSMLRFLRLAGENQDRLAIALHEYSYDVDDVGAIYPYLIGRFQFLFDACDRNGMMRPTVLITEWGWTYNTVPPPAQALVDIRWAARLYAAYPQVKGAAIWYLGDTPSTIEDQTAELIDPVRNYSLSHYFGVDPGFGRVDPSIFRPSP